MAASTKVPGMEVLEALRTGAKGTGAEVGAVLKGPSDLRLGFRETSMPLGTITETGKLLRMVGADGGWFIIRRFLLGGESSVSSFKEKREQVFSTRQLFGPPKKDNLF